MPKELRVNRTGIAVLIALALIVLKFLLYVSRGEGEYVEETIKISQLMAASIERAEAAGDKIAEVRKIDNSEIGQVTKGLTVEGKKEYATLGDQMSHYVITSGLKSLWPKLQYKSEERDRKVFDDDENPVHPDIYDLEIQALAKRDEAVAVNQLAMWIDPLDATQEYTEGETEKDLLKYMTVMICIAVDGRPIAGIIHEPYTEDRNTGALGVTKWAWVGHGVSKMLQQEILSEKRAMDSAVQVIASRSHLGDVFRVAEESFKGFKSIEEITAAGSGYKALQVAERKADLYLHTTAIKKWDICAGDAVLRTLGGKMTTRRGREINYGLHGDPKNSDGIVAVGTEDQHAQFLEKLRL